MKSRDWPGPFLPPVSASLAGGGTLGTLSPGFGSSLGPQPNTTRVSNKTEHDMSVVQFVFTMFFILYNSGITEESANGVLDGSFGIQTNPDSKKKRLARRGLARQES